MKTLTSFNFRGKLIDGKVMPTNPRWVRGMLKLFADSEIVVSVERKKRPRSKLQNNYYWGVVLPAISESTGHTPEELHEIFRSRYLRSKNYWRGADIVTLRSTTELTTNEFAEYLTNIIVESGELGIEIPEADPAYQFASNLT